jgi:hypothetical protein
MVAKEELGAQYIFNVEKLEPGDIILSRIPMSLQDASTWDSHLVQTLTRSRFSWGALHLGNGLCIEALGSGVARLPLSKAGIRDGRNVCVLRLRKGSEWIGKKAAACGLSYAKRGFYREGLPQTKCSAFHDVRRAAVVCAELISNAYRDVEFPLLDNKLPSQTFPGDFLQSTQLEDITPTVLERPAIPFQTAFQVDDNTLFERVHHWEVATQLKVLCNYDVRRILDVTSSRPSSMRELEQMIAEKSWSALDEAVTRGLKWYRYADVYRLRHQHFLDDSKVLPHLIRLLPGALDESRLTYAALAVADDLELLKSEREHWLSQRDYYSQLQQQYDGKVFAYMLDLYNEQLLGSETLMELKAQQKQAYQSELQRRSSRLKTA